MKGYYFFGIAVAIVLIGGIFFFQTFDFEIKKPEEPQPINLVFEDKLEECPPYLGNLCEIKDASNYLEIISESHYSKNQEIIEITIKNVNDQRISFTDGSYGLRIFDPDGIPITDCHGYFQILTYLASDEEKILEWYPTLDCDDNEIKLGQYTAKVQFFLDDRTFGTVTKTFELVE